MRRLSTSIWLPIVCSLLCCPEDTLVVKRLARRTEVSRGDVLLYVDMAVRLPLPNVLLGSPRIG